MGVAIGRRVEHEQSALGSGGAGHVYGTVLKARVDGRIGGHLAAREGGELGLFVGGEKYRVVTALREADLCIEGDGEGGETAGSPGEAAGAARHFGPEQPDFERGVVTVEHDLPGSNRPSVGEAHPCRASALDQDTVDVRAIVDLRAEMGRRARQSVRERSHAALDVPDPLPLDLGDQRQRCGRIEGRTACIRAVSPEQLAQTRIGEVLRHHRVERAIGVELQEPRQAHQPRAPHQRQRRRRLRAAHESPLERAQDRARRTGKRAKSGLGLRAPESAYGLCAAVEVGVKD